MIHTAAVSRITCSYHLVEALLSREELSEDTLHSARPMPSRAGCHPAQTMPGTLTQRQMLVMSSNGGIASHGS